jgi:hypothetical protein
MGEKEMRDKKEILDRMKDYRSFYEELRKSHTNPDSLTSMYILSQYEKWQLLRWVLNFDD